MLTHEIKYQKKYDTNKVTYYIALYNESTW